MSDTSKAAGKTLPAGSIGSVPIWRGIGPRLSLLVVTGCSALVLLTAVLLGEHSATRAVAAHEQLIGNDLVASVDRILNSVRLRRRAELAALVGQPCGDVRRSLTQLQTYVRYVRGLNLVVDGRVYCSSGLGQIDVPLSVYLKSTATGASLNLLPQTPFHPGDPVLAMFDATGQGTGILYLLAGDYIADALSHGVRYGAQNVALSIAGVGLLSDSDEFMPVSKPSPFYATRVTSGAWPFSITLASSTEFVSQLRWQYRLYFGAAGALLDMLIVALYLLAFAPSRLLLNAVRRGLRQHEFHVVYQPIVDIASRDTVGVEALLRWDHPKRGPISPSFFMGEVESSSLLAPVTGFVLHTAVEEMSRHAPTLPLRVAVNIAPGDLERKGFVAEVLAMSRTLPGGISLVLELTERFLLNESADTLAVFKALKAGGVKFAIDDFGTHHSNLDLLSRFPFDYVKIDRQFVSHVDTGGAELIKAIVAVAKHFGLQIIAEGVETEAQHRALRAVGVSLCQGYLYQRPMRAENFERRQKRR
ncbi:EAL domain-containing protein [Paraburkholderia sp. RL17-337-BIB-A]|uniref:EAL domain-containing protein n=1 Tax=Paraburkholderia sp. RL17-337-BIB-A TaxID=3031636 RepID=UPI0038B95DD6